MTTLFGDDYRARYRDVRSLIEDELGGRLVRDEARWPEPHCDPMWSREGYCPDAPHAAEVHIVFICGHTLVGCERAADMALDDWWSLFSCPWCGMGWVCGTQPLREP